MNKTILVVVVVAMLAVAVYFYMKKEEKPDETKAIDKAAAESDASIKIVAPAIKTATQVKAEIVSGLKPDTEEPLSVNDVAVTTQQKNLVTLWHESRNQIYLDMLKDNGIGKDLVPSDTEWYIDDFLKKTYNNVSFEYLNVKPLKYYPQVASAIKNKIEEVRTLKGKFKLVATSNKSEAKQFQQIVKRDILDLTGVDLLSGKDGDATLKAKAQKRCDFVIDWLTKYITAGNAASIAADNVALSYMKSQGWKIKGN